MSRGEKRGISKVFFAIGGALIIAASIIAWLMFGGVGPVKVVLDNGIKAKFSATLKDTEISREKDGKKLWLFKVNEVINDQTSGRAFLRGIKGKVYREDGSYFDVSAKDGEMKMGKQDFEVRNEVVAVLSSDKSKLVADRVTWIDKKQEITATGHVEIWKDDWYARGDKAITDGSFKRLRLVGNAYVERRN